MLCPDNLAVVPRVVEIIMELQSLTVLEGEDATFKCLVSPEDVAVTWQLNGQPVVPSERVLVTRSGLCHSLTLRQCQTGDAGTVTANAEGLVSTARLSVQGEGEGETGAQSKARSWGQLLTQHTGRAEAQVLFVRKLQDVVAEEQGDVCLEVEVSHAAAEVQWLKQGILLQPSSKYLLRESGCQRTLTICCLGPADRGTYRCESLHDRTQAKLQVEREYQAGDGDGRQRGWGQLLQWEHVGRAGIWLKGVVREVSAWAGVDVWCKKLDLNNHSSKHRLGSQGLCGGADDYSQSWVPHSPEGVDSDTAGGCGDL